MSKKTNKKEALITASQAAILLNRSRSRIQNYLERGFLKPVPSKKAKYFFKESDVIALKERLTKNSSL